MLETLRLASSGSVFWHEIYFATLISMSENFGAKNGIEDVCRSAVDYASEVLAQPEILELLKSLPEKVRMDTLGVIAEIAQLEKLVGKKLMESLHERFVVHDVPAAFLDENKHLSDFDELLFVVQILWANLGSPDKNPFTDVNDSEVRDFWQNYFELPHYTYHGCGSGYLERINQEGLKPLTIFYSQDTRQSINDLEKKLPMLFGWGSFQENVTFTSDIPGTAVEYGYRSPEWFSHALGGNMSYHKVSSEDNQIEIIRTAYLLRDKEGCFQNLELLCKTYDLTPEERKFMFELFETTWEKNFPNNDTSTNLLVAYNQTTSVSFQEIYDFATKSGELNIGSVASMRMRSNNDRRHEKIEPERIIGAIKLPKYEDIFPEKTEAYRLIRGKA